MTICSGVGWGEEVLEQKQQQAKLVRHRQKSAHQHHSFSCAASLGVGPMWVHTHPELLCLQPELCASRESPPRRVGLCL